MKATTSKAVSEGYSKAIHTSRFIRKEAIYQSNIDDDNRKEKRKNTFSSPLLLLS